MSYYRNLRQRQNWNQPKVVEHKDISPNERLMFHCATKYYHAFEEGIKGVILTDEMNNPNFSEIVDNCKNGLSYDTKHARNGTVRRIGTI